MPRLLGKFIKAKSLRKKGFSLSEISKKLNISKSTASIWLKNYSISSEGLKRLEKRKLLGRMKAVETIRIKQERINKKIKKETRNVLSSINISKRHLKLFCSLLYICEGGKNARMGVAFCNSDPLLVKAFLNFLRSCFKVDESRFRISLHVHKYHSPQKQISFWSKTTNIPKSQFIKPYLKKNTGKRIRNNYQGCVNVRYHDSILAKKILVLGEELLNKYGDVG